MDDLERANFDKEVMMNNELATALREYKKLLIGLQTYGLKKKLNAIMDDEILDAIEPATDVKSWTFRWIYVLIAVLIVTLAYFGIKENNTVKEDKSGPALYMANYYPDPGLPTQMGENEDFQFDVGMVEYKSGNYSEAIQQWSTLTDDRPEVRYYIGAAYHASGDKIKARDWLNRLKSDQDYYDRAQWYLALISLESQNISETISHLNSIILLKESSYRTRAQELLAQLKN
jgi:tetratricopeptide (TPR) repeat protein